MTAQFIATIIDHSISVLGGIGGALIGFRVIGPKPGTNPKFDEFHKKWGKHLKWLGPLVIVFALVQIGQAFYA